VRKLAEWLRRKGHEAKLVTAPHIPVGGLANASAALTLALRVLAERALRTLDADVVHVHHILFYPQARMAGPPTVLTLHGDTAKQYRMLRPQARRLVEALERAAVLGAERVTAVSPVVTRTYAKRYGRKVIYVPNAIDTADIPAEPAEKEENTVVYLGRLSLEKGVDLLLAAARILQRTLPRARILIVGDGPLRSYVEAFARKYSNITYLGYKPRTEALKLLKKAEVLVLPSRSEGFPTVLLEAALTRTAIVASNIPEIRAVFSKEEAVLVNPSPSELAAAVQYMLENPAYRRKVMNAAYRTVNTKYVWSKVVERYIAVFLKAKQPSET
jgi:1,4-alpha-glucan branching enzyme